MVWQRNETLGAYDFRILGHEVKEDDPRVPMRRLDMPIPYNQAGLHTLAHRLAGLSEQLARLGRSEESARLVVGDAMRLIYAAKQSFAELQKQWNEEYRGLIAAPHLSVGKVEHLRTKTGTAE